MPNLGKTVARLNALRTRGATPANEFAHGAGLLTAVQSFGPNPGDLRMLVHTPRGLSAPAPLVVVLHGCTQTAAAYAATSGWLTLSERLGFTLLAPEQQASNNPNRCFNWFQPEDVRRGSGEAASIRSMIHQLELQGATDPRQVYVTGLSAGGAMCAALLAAYPETFAAGAVVAGLPFGAATNLQEALNLMAGGARLSGRELASRVVRAAPEPLARPRLSIWHGEADRTVVAANARALAEQYAAYHGLTQEPTAVQARGRQTRSTWLDAQGRSLVELNLIAGLGHGVPVSAIGGDPVGEVAPFSLEAGVSSSLEIARFWGLAPDVADSLEAWQDQRSEPAGSAPPQSLGRSVMEAVNPHVTEEVRDVIARALASAGLSR